MSNSSRTLKRRGSANRRRFPLRQVTPFACDNHHGRGKTHTIRVPDCHATGGTLTVREGVLMQVAATISAIRCFEGLGGRGFHRSLQFITRPKDGFAAFLSLQGMLDALRFVQDDDVLMQKRH